MLLEFWKGPLQALQADVSVPAVIVHAGVEAPKDALQLLGNRSRMLNMPLSRFLRARGGYGFDLVVFDLLGFSQQDLDAIAVWRATSAGSTAAVVFIADEAMRFRLLRLGLNRNSNVIKRPLDLARLPSLVKHIKHHAANSDDPQARIAHYARAPEHREALKASDSILDDIFSTPDSGAPIAVEDIASRTDVLIGSLGESGLAGWVDAVRMHHSLTYQHCLLVTGTLLAFGHHLEMGQADLQRLALGGLLHDIGKADIPLAILDKPAKLTDEEFRLMQTHPVAGVERLKKVKGATEEMTIFARDHHEYLDGSGYPNGLMADNISDPVRLLTIADIFAALIERRSYKPEMKPERAIQIMLDMEGKLDKQILGSVLPVLRAVKR